MHVIDVFYLHLTDELKYSVEGSFFSMDFYIHQNDEFATVL